MRGMIMTNIYNNEARLSGKKGTVRMRPMRRHLRSYGLNCVYLQFTADLGAHDIDHFLAGEYMAFKPCVSHFVFG